MTRTMRCVVLALLVAGPAHAEESSYWIEPWEFHGYYRVQGGYSKPDDSNLASTSLGSTSLDETGTIGAAAGIHMFPNFRVDLLEFSWRRFNLETGSRDVDVDAFTLLTNFYYVPFPDWRVSPFVGAGPGLIIARQDKEIFNTNRTELDFAFNARAGVEYRVIDQISLVPEYRFLMDYGAIDGQLPIHEVLVGISVNFY